MVFRTINGLLGLGLKASKSSLFRPRCKICGRPARYGISWSENYCSVRCAKLGGYRLDLADGSYEKLKYCSVCHKPAKYIIDVIHNYCSVKCGKMDGYRIYPIYGTYEKIDINKQKEEKRLSPKLKDDETGEAIEKAKRITQDLNSKMVQLQSILTDLTNNKLKTLEDLEVKKEFSKPKPQKPALPIMPNQKSRKYKASLSLLDYIIVHRKKEKIEYLKNLYQKDKSDWKLKVDQIVTQFQKEMKTWENEKNEFEIQKKRLNQIIAKVKTLYEQKNDKATAVYFKYLLTINRISSHFPNQQEVQFIGATKTLIIDYAIPNPDVIPLKKSLRYSKEQKEFNYIYHTNKFIERFYEILVYRILLCVLYVAFNSDYNDNVAYIKLNGQLRHYDKNSNQYKDICVISLFCDKELFFWLMQYFDNPEKCASLMNGFRRSKSLYHYEEIEPI